VGQRVRSITIPVDRELKEKAAALLKELGWAGITSLMFLKPVEGGEAALTDFNGRLQAFTDQYVAAGVNAPAMWASLATGYPFPPSDNRVRTGVRFQCLELDLRRAWTQRRGGLFHDMIDCLFYALGAVHTLWRKEDLAPALYFGLQEAGAASFRLCEALARSVGVIRRAILTTCSKKRLSAIVNGTTTHQRISPTGPGQPPGNCPNPLFDAQWYLTQYPDVRESSFDPYDHFVRYGACEGRNPNAFFNTAWYLANNSDLRASGMNPLEHYLRHGAAEGRSPRPTIDTVDRAIKDFSSAAATLAAKTGPIDALILIANFGRGGAEKTAVAFSRALREARPNRSIIVIVTDGDVVDDQGLLFEGTYVLCLFDFLLSSDRHKKELFLLRIVLLLAPRICHIINSDVGRSLLRSNGQQLKEITKVYASTFNVRDRTTPEPIGFARYFPDVARYCECILSDNAAVFADIRALFPEEAKEIRFKTIYNPVMWSAPKLESSRCKHGIGNRPAVLWAGRLDGVKRVEMLFEVAALMGDFDFYFFGSKVTDGEVALQCLSNLRYEGPFASPDQLVEKRFYDAYMHTTWREGIPNILLEVAQLDIPIIAPAIGGIPELISDETGYLISSEPSAQEYESGLRAIISNRAASVRRAQALRALVESRHSWLNFARQVGMIDGYT
jgi:glycosyltransferase involved in cell wall biosynthesis